MAGKRKVTAMQAEKRCQWTRQIHIGCYFLSCKGRELRRYRVAELELEALRGAHYGKAAWAKWTEHCYVLARDIGKFYSTGY
jgi:hypothetical protein